MHEVDRLVRGLRDMSISFAEVSRLGEQRAFAIHQTRRKVAGETLEFFRKIQRNFRLPGLNLPATSHLRSQIVYLSGTETRK